MSLLKLLLPLLVIALTFASAASTPLTQHRPSQQPEQKQRKVKSEPKKVYVEWPKQDVRLIITPDELRAYEKLKSDEEREQFIYNFWRIRDPDPDTDENEYKDQYYERIAYANERFSSGKAGWLTDRGRIYVKFGKPDEVETHPSGGHYERPSYEGGGSITTYPFEKWFYRYIPGVGSGIELEFVDPTGSGEYRLAKNPYEKMATLHVPGGASPEEITAANGFGTINYRRQQDSPFEVSQLHRDLEEAPGIKRSTPDTGITGRPTIDYNPLNFQIDAAYFRHSDNLVVVAFTVQTDNKELSFQDSGGVQTAHLNILGRITTVAQRKVGSFEDVVTTSATTAELIDARERKSAYAKAVVLQSGVYRLDVRVRDIASGAEGIQHYGFKVPRYDDKQLAVSSIVLTARLENLKNEPAGGPFSIGQNKVIPNLAHVYHRGQPLGVYAQIYNAGIDQTSLRPSVDVDYTILKDGKQILKQAEDWTGMSEAGQRITLARLIETQGLTAGDYEIVIRIHDQVSGETLSPTTKFTIIK